MTDEVLTMFTDVIINVISLAKKYALEDGERWHLLANGEIRTTKTCRCPIEVAARSPVRGSLNYSLNKLRLQGVVPKNCNLEYRDSEVGQIISAADYAEQYLAVRLSLQLEQLRQMTVTRHLILKELLG